jgi:riboflavin kinase / FMN adenylyltransferase
MQHFYSLDDLRIKNSWVTIGSYDGVHRGHQSIINDMVINSHSAGHPAVVITFFPHPVVALRGIEAPLYLSSPEIRIEKLSGLGVDYVITMGFDRKLASYTPEEFIALLVEHLDIKELWIGYDFALGKNRQGKVAKLAQIGMQSGFQLNVVSPTLNENRPISSSQIRNFIIEGHVDKAASLLGSYYMIPGIVVHGDGRGHQLNVPTANLDIWKSQLVPKYGIYATRVILNGQYLPSVTNVGIRPTFENPSMSPRIETHILDIDQDLYGKYIQLEYIKYLRPEIRYQNLADLVDQIEKDKINAREVLSHVQEPANLSS